MTKLAGRFMKSPVSRFIIPFYIHWYKIDIATLDRPLTEFHSLNDFFKRKLSPEARPIHAHDDAFISPVDGVISQLGQIENGELIQAKGVSYTVEQLLADQDKAELFRNGTYMTIYLSPKDYHRVHAPVDGTITDFSYIPGRLFPVNRIGVGSIDGIFTKNERLATFMDTILGHVAVVKVGALIVGSVQVSYQERIEKLHQGKPYADQLDSCPLIDKGDEIGHFEFGSTVILLFEEDQLDFISSIHPGTSVRMGEALGFRMKKLERKIN
jgi:phosphatidylserine decarboxylase